MHGTPSAITSCVLVRPCRPNASVAGAIGYMQAAITQGKKLLDQIAAGDESSAANDLGPIIRIGITFFQLLARKGLGKSSLPPRCPSL